MVVSMRGFFVLLMIVSMFLLPTLGRSSMIVRGYNSVRHDRFYAGNNKQFIGDPYDFSGVGLSNRGNWATLVSDNCFLSSVHRHPSAGQKVTFWASNDQNGVSYTYKVTGGTRIGGTDLWVGWFSPEVSVDPSIARYPVPVLTLSNHYHGLELYNYGVKHRLGRNVLDSFDRVTIGGSRGFVLLYDYDNNDVPSVGGDETYLNGGDSGGPSFAVFNSRLALIGIHWGKTSYPASSTDTFVAAYFDQINKILGQRGQSLRRSWRWR